MNTKHNINCSHEVVLEIGTQSGWGEPILKNHERPTLNTWCTACGAISVWNELGTDLSWITPSHIKIKKAYNRVTEIKLPICIKCNDTHYVVDSRFEYEIMCTYCPSPCQRCRLGGNGPYCTKTPCACDCHLENEYSPYVNRT